MKQLGYYFLTALLVFFTPIIGLIVSVGLAILFDTITGVLKVAKKGGVKSLNSRSLSQVVSKMVLYQGCLLLLYVMDFYLLNEFTSCFFSVQFLATKITCVLLLFIEMVSIKENIEEFLNIKIWYLLKKSIIRAKELRSDYNDIIK